MPQQGSGAWLCSDKGGSAKGGCPELVPNLCCSHSRKHLAGMWWGVMGKRSLAGFFMTVAKGWGCVKAQSWHPEGVSPDPVLGVSWGAAHRAPSSFLMPWGAARGVLPHPTHSWGWGLLGMPPWSGCDIHNGAVLGAVAGMEKCLGKCHHGTANPAGTMGVSRGDGCCQGRRGIAGTWSCQGGHGHQQGRKRSGTSPRRKIGLGEKDQLWDSNPACEWDGVVGRWDMGCWVPSSPVPAQPRAGLQPCPPGEYVRGWPCAGLELC